MPTVGTNYLFQRFGELYTFQTAAIAKSVIVYGGHSLRYVNRYDGCIIESTITYGGQSGR